MRTYYIFSYILIKNQKLAGKTVAFWVGIAFIAIGILSIFLLFKLKKMKTIPPKIGSEIKNKWEAINVEINVKLKNSSNHKIKLNEKYIIHKK